MSAGAGRRRSGAGEGLPARPVSVNRLVAFNMAFFRKVAGLTQAQMGALIGDWSNAGVSAAERSWDGKRVRQFDADEIVSIALVLGIPVIGLLLPPPDDGVAFRYVLNNEPGQPGITDLLPQLAPAYGGDTPALVAFRERMLALRGSQYEADDVLTRARYEADDLLTKARHVSEAVTGDARARAEALERDAQERYAQAVGDLVKAHEELEQRVEDLLSFEQQYRRRLLGFLEGQLADLKAGDRPDSGVIAAFMERRRQSGGGTRDGQGEQP